MTSHNPDQENEPAQPATHNVEDMGGTRSGQERRQKKEQFSVSERRSGRDRRRGFDRRSNIERRRSDNRRLRQAFWNGEPIERRDAFRKLIKG
jgi:hypothetical protein